MPFDDTNWRPPETPKPSKPRVSKRDELVLLVLMCALAFALLVLPISLGALGDLIRYLTRR